MVQAGGLARIGERRLALAIGVVALAVGLGVATLAPTDAALLLAGAVVVTAALIWPAVSLALLAFAVPFGAVRTLDVGGFALGGVELATALLAIAWLADGVRRRQLTFAPGPLFWPLALLLVAFSLSVWDAFSMPASLAEMAKWCEVALVYALGATLITTRRQAAIVVAAILAAGLAESVLGLYGAVMRLGPPSYAILDGQLYRASGDFAQPNPFGGYMNHVWPLALAIVTAGLSGACRARRTDPTRRVTTPPEPERGISRSIPILALATGLAALAALVASWSRGAWLGAAVGAVVMVAVWSAALLWSRQLRDRRLGRRVLATVVAAGALIAAVGVLGAADLLPASIAGRLTSIGDDVIVLQDLKTVKVTDANFAAVERMAHWWAGLRMWDAYPWTGVGLGNYAEAYATYKVAGWDDALGHAHNVYINVGAEAGTIGLAAYLIFVGCAAGLSVRRALRADNAWDRALAVGVIGVLAAKMVQDGLDNLWVHGMGVQVALLLALLGSRGPTAAGGEGRAEIPTPPGYGRN